MADTLDRVRRFSAEARADIGYQLELVQSGETTTDFRPMPDVGPGAMEIRVHAGSEYRVFYVARFEEAIYILHCFQKNAKDARRGYRIGTATLSCRDRRTNEGYKR
jgi:phage-related protein